MQSRIGILLAGGLSRRYGSPKAFATFQGKAFYKISYDILASMCEEVIIVARPEFVDWFPNEYHVILDRKEYTGCGPLAGIYSAMVEKEVADYVVLPCDMPLLEKDLIKRLLEYHQGVITYPKIDGRTQPLVSIWSGSMVHVIKDALDQKQYKMKDLFDRQDVTIVESTKLTDHPHCFLNVNTPEELRKWRKS
jgi:molybdopterin-guanine dinucleotide biosynthesis protein A